MQQTPQLTTILTQVGCLYLSVCVCLSVCLYLSVCVSLCVSVCLSLCVSVCISLHVCVCVCLSVCVSIRLSVCLYRCWCVLVCLDDAVEPRRHRIGSIADYDPVNEQYGSLTQGYRPTSRGSQSYEWQETITLPPQQKSTISDTQPTASAGLSLSVCL